MTDEIIKLANNEHVRVILLGAGVIGIVALGMICTYLYSRNAMNKRAAIVEKMIENECSEEEIRKVVDALNRKVLQ